MTESSNHTTLLAVTFAFQEYLWRLIKVRIQARTSLDDMVLTIGSDSSEEVIDSFVQALACVKKASSLYLDEGELRA